MDTRQHARKRAREPLTIPTDDSHGWTLQCVTSPMHGDLAQCCKVALVSHRLSKHGRTDLERLPNVQLVSRQILLSSVDGDKLSNQLNARQARQSIGKLG
jgi:hypothetical protein